MKNNTWDNLFVGKQNKFSKISSTMVAYYENKCHYSFSSTNKISALKADIKVILYVQQFSFQIWLFLDFFGDIRLG